MSFPGSPAVDEDEGDEGDDGAFVKTGESVRNYLTFW